MNKTAIKTVVDGFNQCVNGNGIAKKKKPLRCIMGGLLERVRLFNDGERETLILFLKKNLKAVII